MEAESNIIGGGASIMNENVNIASKLYAHKKLRFSLILLFNGITKLKEMFFIIIMYFKQIHQCWTICKSFSFTLGLQTV